MKHFIQKTGGAHWFAFFLIIGLFSYQNAGAQTSSHFVTVWQGQNGQEHMNFLVISAELEHNQLAMGDEIAVFDGLLCVGAAKLTKDLNPADNTTYVSIQASHSDGSNNGFTEGDDIVYKFWDSSAQKEYQVASVVYKNNMATWSTTGKFSVGASSVVELAYNTGLSQTLSFIKGNNLFSTYLIPNDPDLTVVMKSLTDAGLLVSVQDESGATYAYNAKKKVWTNSIGSVEPTEGYLVNVSANCDLQIYGNMIALPLDIPLKSGWNIISYPTTTAVSAMSVVQPLIDQKKLIKVQDEKGNAIQQARKGGAWIDNIGTFYPGEAYKIDVSSSTTLTFK